MTLTLAIGAYLATGITVSLTFTRIDPDTGGTITALLWPIAVTLFVGGLIYGFWKGE